MESLSNEEILLKTTKEYAHQIQKLLNMAKRADQKKIQWIVVILKKMKKSLSKLASEDRKLKRYANNPVKYKLILKPYIDLLEKVKIEIEKVGDNNGFYSDSN